MESVNAQVASSACRTTNPVLRRCATGGPCSCIALTYLFIVGLKLVTPT